ncbi:hypothetical protein OJ996_24010 [Luteolibacter sp. GHJ8]|jgi:hypothetical protein|uniref:Addiction module protein n=1 Tax=Luteolibacter rhizosphaerae TaxID=2989719 RepID=A0ABT3G9Z9_9BACT|nr:hypothetical protein [Luteolibacter rhizosphaerae]MCW1916673.1 hypothetical protein [Luteolibacter rhizosphaerae]
MNLAEVLQELPRFTVAERQELIRSALICDDSDLNPDEMAIVAERLEAHDADSSSSLSLDEIRSRLASRLAS